MATVAAPDPADEARAPQASVDVTLTCRSCQRQFTRHSRRAYTAKCPHCQTVNVGPGLMAELTKTPDPGARRRRTRREAAAAARAEKPAAPVRRRASSQASGAGKTPATPPDVAPAASSPPPRRRGLLDRFMYGEDDDDGD